MKKTFILTTSLLLLAVSAHAQKILRNSRDPVTNVLIVETDQNPISEHYGCRLRAVNHNLYMECAMIGGDVVYDIPGGSAFVMTLKDGRRVELPVMQSARSEYFTISMCEECVDRLELKFKMFLPSYDLEMLRNGTITEVCVETDQGMLRRSVAGEDARKLRKMFGLLQKKQPE